MLNLCRNFNIGTYILLVSIAINIFTNIPITLIIFKTERSINKNKYFFRNITKKYNNE